MAALVGWPSHDSQFSGSDQPRDIWRNMPRNDWSKNSRSKNSRSKDSRSKDSRLNKPRFWVLRRHVARHPTTSTFASVPPGYPEGAVAIYSNTSRVRLTFHQGRATFKILLLQCRSAMPRRGRISTSDLTDRKGLARSPLRAPQATQHKKKINSGAQIDNCTINC